MSVVFLSIVIGVLLLPIIREIGLSGKVSMIASRALTVLAYIVIFLVGFISGNAVKSPMVALSVVALSLLMSVVAMLSSFAVAVAVTRILQPRYPVAGAPGSLGSTGLSFTPVRAVVVLVAGGALGVFTTSYISKSVLDHVLYYLVAVLVFAAILSLSSELEGIRESIGFVGLGAVLAATTMVSSGLSLLVFQPVARIGPRVLVAIGAASGWYSLVGPLLATINPLYGLIGFLANMFRESLHILLYPLASAKGYALPAVAMGGATSMDTGLPVIAIYGDKAAMLTGMIQGVVITLAAPLVLSLLV